jgi:Na+/melibiose symporter-like transporter
MGNAGTSAAQKLGLGLGQAVFGWVLAGAGFDAKLDLQGLPQPESVITAIKFMYNWIPMVMCAIITVIMALTFHLDRDLAKLRAALRSLKTRRDGIKEELEKDNDYATKIDELTEKLQKIDKKLGVAS